MLDKIYFIKNKMCDIHVKIDYYEFDDEYLFATSNRIFVFICCSFELINHPSIFKRN